MKNVLITPYLPEMSFVILTIKQSLQMNSYHIAEDIKLFTVTATKFPEGVQAAFEQLHSLTSIYDAIAYYGISYANANGGIIYKAAVALKDSTTDIPGIETYFLQAGEYRGMEILNFREHIADIGKTFQELIQHPDINKNGCCIEVYYNDTDVRCMVKIEKPVAKNK